MKFLSPADYCQSLATTLQQFNWELLEPIVRKLTDAWTNGNGVFLCGNGGSAGNASHLANDFIYGVGKGVHPGLNVQALSANPAVITCLGNDVGFDSIYSAQLLALGKENDILIALSGSGNSPNIIKALETAKEKKITSVAILGFDGGKAKALADLPLHFPINDMQIAEDAQMIVGHILVKACCNAKLKAPLNELSL